MKKYMCPVCGFFGLDEPPYNDKRESSFEICSCCGFEFGFDEGKTDDKYNTFRSIWIENGANWFLPEKRPEDWDLDEQLKNLKT
ncbi:MAG: hypothetical protein PHG69_01070 [Candidatus Omnitrophica bacterium]|nr:hypothetical protein [Candidatus Omnitrophota bacterium]